MLVQSGLHRHVQLSLSKRLDGKKIKKKKTYNNFYHYLLKLTPMARFLSQR